MKRQITSYESFVAENTQDPEVDKEIERIIDEQMALGKSDRDVVDHVNRVLGISGHDTPTVGETTEAEETYQQKELAKLKK